MVRFFRGVVVVAGVLFMGSCFSLSGLSAFPCAKDGTCPDTYYCNASNQCASCCNSNSNNCACISTNDGTAGCDPAEQSACSGGCVIMGAACTLYEDDCTQPECQCASAPWSTVCGGAGTGTQGSTCGGVINESNPYVLTSVGTCAPGFVCVGCGQCEQLCDLLHPSSKLLPTCPGGTTCSSFGTIPGPVINGVYYGVCSTPTSGTGGAGGASCTSSSTGTGGMTSCNVPPVSGPWIAEVLKAEDPPNPEGGVILPGEYVLIDINLYTGPSGETGANEVSVRETSTYSDGMFASNQQYEGNGAPPSAEISGTYSLNANVLVVAMTCPMQAAAATLGFTANGNTLKIYTKGTFSDGNMYTEEVVKVLQTGGEGGSGGAGG
jgi:hypothetical protein